MTNDKHLYTDRDYLEQKFSSISEQVSALSGKVETQTQIFSEKSAKIDDTLQDLTHQVKLTNGRVKRLEKEQNAHAVAIATNTKFREKLVSHIGIIATVGAIIMTFISILFSKFIDSLNIFS